MAESNKRLSLETVANTIVLAMAFVALGLLALNYFAKTARPQIESGIHRGSSLSKLSGVNYKDYSETLLIVLNTKCQYCRESVPFYRQLLARKEDKQSPYIVAVFPNSRDEIDQFLAENDLQIEAISNTQLAELGLAGTPALILLNAKGEVLDFWLGKVSRLEGQQLLNSIFPPRKEVG